MEDMFVKHTWWYLLCILYTLVEVTTAAQNAGYYCVTDRQYSDLLHIDFQLNPADDTVNKVYAYKSADDTPLSDCSASHDSTNNIYHLRITMNTTSHEQISPSTSCGGSFSSDMYTHTIRSFVNEGMISSSDKLYSIRCKSGTEAHTTGTVVVGSIDHITITGSTPQAKLQLASVPDLTTISSANIGDKVRLKFTLTFSDAKENLDVIGARLINLIVSPSDNYQPINRTIIDENGCAVNHSESVLAVTGPFETTSNGTSPFIAYSPEMEIARFSVLSGILYFQVYAEYCYNVDCFATMCKTRMKRATDTNTPEIIISQFYITVNNPVAEQATDIKSPCFDKMTFVAIVIVLAVIILGEIIVVFRTTKNLAEIKSKISPSPDISFEKLPLCNVNYKNPMIKDHPPELRNHIGRIVL